jgi:uncharacterized protein (DUF697 family)
MAHIYERLIGLVEKLPDGLRKPILKEIVPIRQFFLEKRPARIVLLGAQLDTLPDVQSIFSGPAGIASAGSQLPAEVLVKEPLDTNWDLYKAKDRMGVEVLDLRGEFHAQAFLDACARRRPDAILFFQRDSLEPDPAVLRSIAQAFPTGEGGSLPAFFGIASSGVQGAPEFLLASLRASKDIAAFPLKVLDASQHTELAEMVAKALPNQARLSFALLFDARKSRVEIASSLLNSFTAVCGVIGMQPIPLADLPILSGIQSLMVGMIAYVGGRRMEPKVITEFLGVVGLSVGAGMLFRQAARALIRIVPFWGNAVSGVIAAAGTYAIGRAAIAYFVEDIPIQEARKLFQTLKPKGWLFEKKAFIPSANNFTNREGDAS